MGSSPPPSTDEWRFHELYMRITVVKASIPAPASRRWLHVHLQSTRRSNWSLGPRQQASSPVRRRDQPVVAAASENSESGSDDGGVYRVDLNDLEGASRRSLLVSFTCNACGGRSERLVNPLAWQKGMVIVQCEQCKAWHKIADSQGMVEEYRFGDNSDDE